MSVRGRVRLLDIIVFLGIGYLLWALYFKMTDSPDDYFIVNKVYVEDHPTGTNATVIYDRKIKKEFSANWQADIKSIDSGIVVCVARGTHIYRESETLIVSRNLDWYLERTCPSVPGEYLITTIWLIGKTGMEITNTSNVYRVYSNTEWDEIQRTLDDQGRRDAERKIELGPPPPPFPKPDPENRDKRPLRVDKE